MRADDDPHDLAKPRGKQDWQLEPHSIWYPRTTGIWQTVWLERVPATWIDELRWTPNLERWEIGCDACGATARARDGLRLRGAADASTSSCSPTNVYAVVAGGSVTAASRCPTPASTTPATSCCGVPARRR